MVVWLLFTGCKEELPTYASFPQAEHTSFPCLNYTTLTPNDKQVLQQTLQIQERAICPYRVLLTWYYVGNCNNPVVKSLGSDFDGYVRIEIKKGFKCYYKNDRDGAFDRVLKKLKMDINQ